MGVRRECVRPPPDLPKPSWPGLSFAARPLGSAPRNATGENTMPQITANGIQLEYETYGDPAQPPLLLVMGLGAQLTLWPMELVEALVARGYYVIRYDNRDIGLSQKFDAGGIPNFKRVALLRMLRLRARIPYRLSDMADDVPRCWVR